MDKIDAFINDIIDAKKLNGVDEEVRNQLIEDVRERLLDQINRALIDAMPDERIDQFNKLLDKEEASDEELQQFITDSGVDVPSVTAATMLRFSELYLGADNSSQEPSEE